MPARPNQFGLACTLNHFAQWLLLCCYNIHVWLYWTDMSLITHDFIPTFSKLGGSIAMCQTIGQDPGEQNHSFCFAWFTWVWLMSCKACSKGRLHVTTEFFGADPRSFFKVPYTKRKYADFNFIMTTLMYISASQLLPSFRNSDATPLDTAFDELLVVSPALALKSDADRITYRVIQNNQWWQ